MPEHKQPEITRSLTVLVADKETNQYGDIIFHDIEGNQYKLGVKRANYADQIVPQSGAKLDFAEYMNKEYILKVTRADLPKTEGKIPPVVLDEKTKADIKEANKPSIDLRQRSICLSYSVWLAQYGMIPVDCLGSIALQLERYCSGNLEADQLDTNLKTLLKKKG